MPGIAQAYVSFPEPSPIFPYRKFPGREGAPRHSSYRSGRFILSGDKLCLIFPTGKMFTLIASAADFAAALVRAREALDLTQRDLALAIGVGERFIVDLEADKPTAQLGTVLAAPRAVGMRLADTAESEPETPPAKPR